MYSLFAFIFQNSFLFRGVLLFILGAVVGSFLNVVIYRLPIILKQQWKNDAKDVLQLESSTTLEASSDTIGMNSDTNDHNDSLEHKFNLFYPFSHCPLCKTKIRFWTNIPIIGYFLINGRCLHCQSKIAIVYPLVELITAVLFVAVGFFTNSPWLLMAYLAFVSIVICLIVIDYNEMLLPDELTLSLLWLGLLANLNGAVCGSLQSAVIGAFVGYLVLWLVYWLVKLITHKDGMGYGDFKFFAAILAWFGYQWFAPILLMATVLGISYYVAGRFLGKIAARSEIPFGAFLGISAIIVVFLSKYYIILPFTFSLQ